MKGRPRVLVKDGVRQRDALARGQIGEHDLLEALRLNGRITRVEEVQEARLERNGQISVIPRARD